MKFPYICSKCGEVESFHFGTCPICGGKLVRQPEQEPNMYDELKAWADKWGVPYVETLANEKCAVNTLVFDSMTYYPAEFDYNPKTGEYYWYGGD